MSVKRKITIIILCVLCIIAVACTIVSYAYFSKKEIYDGYFSGQLELLFDRLNDNGITKYQEALNKEYEEKEYGEGETPIPAPTVNKNATWGSEAYPYVISNVRHLYNLSELQRLGYFHKKFISQNAEGEYSNVPYFLVCTSNYTPALIDGTSFKNITAIGTDAYPFIGSVKGVKSDAANEKINIGGKTCDTSALHNVTVAGDPKNVDVGLFGVIGYLKKTDPTTGEQSTTFEGQTSTVSNLVLSDIQVVVKSSLWDAVVSFVEDIMINADGGHQYSFSELHGTDDYDKVPHENHHIGILAGHVSYTTVEFISVYYSADDVVAMNLTDATEVGGKKANYLSATGILGFIDNINPTIITGADGKQTITAGSGSSYGDLTYGSVGGGGAVSGEKAGYVMAGEMYNKFHFTRGEGGTLNEDTTGTVKLKDALDNNGKALCTEWVRDRILWGTENTGRYYFYDGVFTFALSDQADVIEPTWKNGIPDFSIGQDDDSKWKMNTAEGNKAVVAYIKKVTSDRDFQAAISAGKQIFIMQEGKESLFLMSLYSQSTAGSGDFEEKYTTPGTTQQFASKELVDSLIAAYNNNELTLPENNDMTADYDTVGEIVEGLSNKTLRVINVGITSSGVSLDDLKLKYKITPKVTGNYTYFDGNTPVAVNPDGTINQYYDYATSDYDGYFYYTLEQESATSRKYEYYWQPKEGAAIQIGTATSTWIFGWTGQNLPNDFFATAGEVWQEENVYTHTFNGTEYKGVVVNKSEGTFFNSGRTANANGATLTKPATGESPLYYFYDDITTQENKYTYSGAGGGIFDPSQLIDTGKKSPSGKPIYGVGDKEGVRLDRYPTYNFSNENNYLRMIRAAFNLFGTHYVLWNGTNDAANTASNFRHNFFGQNTPTVSNSTEATLRFNDDGTCYIQYSIDSTGLYVNSTGSVFNTAASNDSAGAKLCIYTVEGTQDIAYGRITYDPIDDAASDIDSYSFSAGEYVLKANINEETKATEYTVTRLADKYSEDGATVLENGLNWNNGLGNTLSREDLLKKFKMVKGITFGGSLNILNGTLGSDGIITAPVGTDGVEANIPQACVAFKINKPMQAKIRVIVSVATSEFYPGEEEYDLGGYTRYFNLWKMEAAGDSWVQIFRAENYLERFEIPRSHPYDPSITAANAPHLTVKYNDANYRCYLNGDRVLIAYEFIVDTTSADTGVGVYCLGMSGIAADGSVVGDVPMEIVYFSADGVASAGRDGLSGSQIGTIDFVYDYGDKIVTVTESSSTNAEGKEDYNTYYPSYCLLHFNPKTADSTPENPQYVDVNNEMVIIRRYVDTTANSDVNHNKTPSFSTLKYKLDGDGHVRVVQYSHFADNVRQDGVELNQ